MISNVIIVEVVLFFVGSSHFLPISGAPRLENVKIVGGHNISIEEVPYQVAIQQYGEPYCGGSIISATEIVTAAHCVSEEDPKTLSIRAGSSIRGKGGQVIPVNNKRVHPNWNSQRIDCDIAVLELSSELVFGKSVAPIPLPSPNQTWPVGTEVLVTGWGLLHEDDTTFPMNLQGVILKIVDRDVCRSVYGQILTSHMICAGISEGGKDACQEDSGGPLAVNGVLAGVVSFGDGCGKPSTPGVYSNVADLLNFVRPEN